MESFIFIYAVWRNVDSDIHIYVVKVMLISARCDTVFHISGYFTIIYSDVCCELG